MPFTIAPTIPVFDHKKGVRKAYTEEVVSFAIQAKKAAGKSLREIAADYGHPINHADIERILAGIFPKGRDKRRALNLAPVCPECLRDLPRQPRRVPEWLRLAANELAKREVPIPYENRRYTRTKKLIIDQ